MATEGPKLEGTDTVTFILNPGRTFYVDISAFPEDVMELKLETFDGTGDLGELGESCYFEEEESGAHYVRIFFDEESVEALQYQLFYLKIGTNATRRFQFCKSYCSARCHCKVVLVV